MRPRLFPLVAALIALFVSGAVAEDTVERAWVFTTPGDYQGWTPGAQYSGSGVSGGVLWADTSGATPDIDGPDINLTGRRDHYLELTMRLTTSSSTSDAQLQWTTDKDPTWTTSKTASIKVFGDGRFHTYRIYPGAQTSWYYLTTVRQLRVRPCSVSGAYVEISSIRLMRYNGNPPFSLQNTWTYYNGETTNQTSPTVVVRDLYDEITNISQVDFYYRTSPSGTWVLDGNDNNRLGGFQYTYHALPPGTYDLRAVVRTPYWHDGDYTQGDDRWIQRLTIDPSAPTRIDVNAADVLGAVPKQMTGCNVQWIDWRTIYNVATGCLPDDLEALVADMGLSSLRYPGGCNADTFFWKQSIGPQNARPVQYASPCSAISTIDSGPVKFGLDEFLRWCEQRGVQPVLTVRFRWPGAPGIPGMEGGDAYTTALQDAADMVEYCNAPNDGSNPGGGTDWASARAANGHPAPYNVKVWEIGNEPYGSDYYGSPNPASMLDGACKFGKTYLVFQDAMKAIDPSIQVGPNLMLPSVYYFDRVTNVTWTYAMLLQVGQYLDYGQAHVYLPNAFAQTDPTKCWLETMATPRVLDDFISLLRSNIKLTVPEKLGHLKMRFTEWSTYFGSGYHPPQYVNRDHVRSLKAAVCAADEIRVMMENRDLVESANWWLIYGSYSTALIDRITMTPNPVFHTLKIYNKHFGDNLVGSRVTGSPTFDHISGTGSVQEARLGIPQLSAIASKNAEGSALYLIVINKDRDNSISANVKLDGFGPSLAAVLAADIWELNGPDPADTGVPNSAAISKKSIQCPAAFTYSFPAHSVTSFKFTVADANGRVGYARDLPDSVPVVLKQKVVTAKLPPDVLYVEEENRAAGIRVVTSNLAGSEGNRADVTGVMGTNPHGERQVVADSVVYDTSSVGIGPLAMSQSHLAMDALTPGLLVKAFGVSNGRSGNTFYLSDGSGLSGFPGHEGLKVYADTPPADGSYVVVTGIRSQEIPEGGAVPCPVIRTRRGPDVVTLK